MDKIEQIASKRGYVVTEDGILFNPNGLEIGKVDNVQGYFITTLRVNKVGKILKIHRLQAFQKYGSKLYEKGILVRHLDGDKKNNSWDNIVIGTHSDNMMDIPEQIRIKRALHAASFNKKYDKEKVKAYYKNCKSYKKTMEKFNISSKGTLHNILNK